jgi:hypothetical protein
VRGKNGDGRAAGYQMYAKRGNTACGARAMDVTHVLYSDRQTHLILTIGNGYTE